MARLTTVAIQGQEFPFGPLVCDCEGFQASKRARREEQVKLKRAEEKLRQETRIQELFRRSTLPERWRSRTFDCFQVTPHNETAFLATQEYAQWFDGDGGRGLLFTGPVGVGKTHLAAATAMELLGREHSVIFGSVTSLLARVRNTFDSDRVSEMQVMRHLTSCELLVIDDLGKEKVTEWVAQTVYELINTRYERNRALLVTTNLGLTAIRDKYNVGETSIGDAIVDRILEVCEGVKFSGKSWRKKDLM